MVKRSHLLSADLIHQGTSRKHPDGLGDLGKPLEKGDRPGADRWLSIDGSIGHLANKRREWKNISWNLLLELTADQRVSYSKQANRTPSFRPDHSRKLQNSKALQKTFAVRNLPIS